MLCGVNGGGGTYGVVVCRSYVRCTCDVCPNPFHSIHTSPINLSTHALNHLNHLFLNPRSPTPITQVVEECAERLTDEDVDALCELVATHLGGLEEAGGGSGSNGKGAAVEMEVRALDWWMGEFGFSVVEVGVGDAGAYANVSVRSHSPHKPYRSQVSTDDAAAAAEGGNG